MIKRTHVNNRNKQIIKLAIRVLITVSLLLCLFSKINFQQFFQYLKAANWQFIIPIFVIVLIRFAINSAKMKLILKKQQCSISIRTIFAASAVTSFYSMFIPGLLSTSAKWYILKKHTGAGSQVFTSMLYNQFTELATVIISALIALAILNPVSVLFPAIKNTSIFPIICSIIIITAVSIFLSLLNPRIAQKVANPLSLILRYLPPALRQKARDILTQLAVFQSASCRFHLLIICITIANTFIGSILIYILAAKAANITAPISVFFWIPATIYILGRLPISIANLGIREITLVGVLTAYGINPSAALLMSMILFSCAVFMAAIGATCQIRWAITKKQTKTANFKVF